MSQSHTDQTLTIEDRVENLLQEIRIGLGLSNGHIEVRLWTGRSVATPVVDASKFGKVDRFDVFFGEHVGEPLSVGLVLEILRRGVGPSRLELVDEWRQRVVVADATRVRSNAGG